LGITNNSYNLALTLLGGCIITIVAIIVYIIGIIRYVKKQEVSIKEIEKIDVNNIDYKENI
jgi:hypothetical protein